MDRRRFLLASSASALALGAPAAASAAVATAPAAARPRPTSQQLAWQREELALFVHYTVNTYTDREWGEGDESPRLFAPTNLDARQW
ncbi:hypothetical protein RNS25_12530, partial [Staphylococcus pseudintermedius]|nr:hypothetical protein [Staphylococcus pseudintermedius]